MSADLGPCDLWPDPPEMPEPVCGRCGIDLDPNMTPEHEYRNAWDRAAHRPSWQPLSEDDFELPPLAGYCADCGGYERCLACGQWIDPEDVESFPDHCPGCGENRHGITLPEPEALRC